MNTYKNDDEKGTRLDDSIQKLNGEYYSKNSPTGNSKFVNNSPRYPNTGDKTDINWILFGFVITGGISGLYFLKKDRPIAAKATLIQKYV